MTGQSHLRKDPIQARPTRRNFDYGVPLLAVTGFGGILALMGDPANLIFAKLAAVPLFLLAGRATSVLLPFDKDAPGNRAYWERFVLDALLLSCLLTILLWTPDKSVGSLIINFLVLVPAYVAGMSVLRLLGSRKTSVPDSSSET
jgi:hypothetical protein